MPKGCCNPACGDRGVFPSIQASVQKSEPEGTRLPVLSDVKAPLELKVGFLVVVDEAGDGVVVTPSEHTRRSFLLLDYWESTSV